MEALLRSCGQLSVFSLFLLDTHHLIVQKRLETFLSDTDVVVALSDECPDA